MINKFNKISILLFFILTSCGYSPIFSAKSTNFKILNLSLEGNKKINRIIDNKLKNYKKNQKAERIYVVKINSKKNKKIISKDTKGNPDKFNLELLVSIEVENQDNNKNKKNFIKNISYNNLSNKFELSEYENNIEESLALNISEEIIIYIQSL